MYEDYLEDTITGSDGEPLGEGFDELDGVIESVIILGLIGAILFLMYYRARRQQAHREAEENAARQGQQQQNGGVGGVGLGPAQPAPGQAPRGLFPQPGDPDFAGWPAGANVGH